MTLHFNSNYAQDFLRENDIKGLAAQVAAADLMIKDKNGLGNDFLGWVDLPENYDREEFARIKKAAEKIKKDTDVLVVIGIGGSYLGARAAIEFLKSHYYNNLTKDTPDIYFAGNSISGSALAAKVFLVCVINLDYKVGNSAIGVGKHCALKCLCVYKGHRFSG